MPQYRNRVWDGKIRLFSYATGKIYAGLYPYIKNWCKENNVHIVDGTKIKEKTVDDSKIDDLIKALKLPYEVRDYQREAFKYSVEKDRCLLVSPTASGKSLIIYYLIRYYLPEKALVIVPTLSLVSQMYTDFEAYAKIDDLFDVEQLVHKIYGGQEKETDKPIIISTWQSLYELNKDFFGEMEDEQQEEPMEKPEATAWYYILPIPKDRDDPYCLKLVSNATDENGLLKEMGLAPGTFFVELMDNDGLGYCQSEEEIEILYKALTGKDLEN